MTALSVQPSPYQFAALCSMNVQRPTVKFLGAAWGRFADI